MGGDLLTFEILHRRFLDEFDKYAAGGDGSPNWEVTGGTWSITSEAYRAQTSAVGHKSVREDLTMDDLRVEFEQNWTSATNWQVGFFFRGEAGDEVNDCYFVTLKSDGLYLIKYVGGTPTTLGSYSFTPATSTDYIIKIHCKGEDSVVIKVYLDGTLRINQTDSTNPHASGTVGFISQSSGSEDVTFDDVDCWGIERSVLSFLVRKSISSRIKSFSCVLDNVNGFRTGRYAFNDDIEIWRGVTLQRIFAGFIEDVVPDSEEGLTITLSGRDYTARMLFVSCYETYTSQEIANILKDLLTKYAPTLTQNHIQNTGISLAPVYRKRRLHSIGRELAEIADFEIWVDADKDVWFVPRTYTDSGKTFAVGDNIFDYRLPDQGSKTVNRVTVYGKTGIAVEVANYELREQMGFWKEDEIVDPAIDTAAEAKKRGEAYLAQVATPRVYQIDTYLNEDLEEGQLVRVQIPKENIDGQSIVLGIDFQYPDFPTTILTVAEYRTGVEQIIAVLKEEVDTLLREQMDLAATLERWVSLTEGPTLDDTKLTISRKMISDSFILGHSTYGVLGASGYGLGDRSGAWVVLQEVVNP